MQLPRMFALSQEVAGPEVADVAARVRSELANLRGQRPVRPGQSVAITAGSRGIRDIVTILRHTVAHFVELGTQPFLVPAMGSHGGGTADGQVRLLAEYGIDSQTVGAPVRASMDTTLLGRTPQGVPVYFDRIAAGADHIMVVGRVKPHTDFSGPIQSGLLKMLMIGLGKHAGAKIAHRAVQDFSFEEIVRSVGRLVIARLPVLGGLAIVENGRERTAHIQALAAADFETGEPPLLEMARTLMATLPFDAVDLLIVDEIGKDISGTGMDTNVINRKPGRPPQPIPQIKKIYVRGLSPHGGGNASGIGNADLTHRRLVAAADWSATLINCVTSGWLRAAAVPATFDSDREAITVALRTVGLVEPPAARVLRIRNTLSLNRLWASEAYYDEVAARSGQLRRLGEPQPMSFDAAGNLVDDAPAEDPALIVSGAAPASSP